MLKTKYFIQMSKSAEDKNLLYLYYFKKINKFKINKYTINEFKNKSSANIS